MALENFTLNVYNPSTGQTEEIRVSEDIYREYRRSGWCIDNSDRRFRRHETPFSELKSGIEGPFEYFREFRSEEENPANLVVEKQMQEQQQTALERLDEDDRLFLLALFEPDMTEREMAAAQGVSQVAIHKRKQRLIKKLKKYLI